MFGDSSSALKYRGTQGRKLKNYTINNYREETNTYQSLGKNTVPSSKPDLGRNTTTTTPTQTNSLRRGTSEDFRKFPRNNNNMNQFGAILEDFATKLTWRFQSYIEKLKKTAWTIIFALAFLLFVYLLLFVPQKSRISNDSALICAFLSFLFASLSFLLDQGIINKRLGTKGTIETSSAATYADYASDRRVLNNMLKTSLRKKIADE